MSWLVLGGSGFVGSAVVRALTAAGVEASAAPAPRLATHTRTAAGLVEEGRRVDLTALRELIRGHDVVVNAAGLALPASAETPELFGANALLPVVVMLACGDAGTARLVHLSSAAVQGRVAVLDESDRTHPFSAYSASKALGEEALALAAATHPHLSVVTLRATSVQGAGRPTTTSLARLARSPLATVAAPGSAPTPVTSVESLAELVLALGRHGGTVPPRVLQPWEGLTVRTVLTASGGRPRALPRPLCSAAVRCGYAVSAILRGRLDGQVRRVELLWFGQQQVEGWASENGLVPRRRVHEVLAAVPSQG